jgi:hypothetical protein
MANKVKLKRSYTANAVPTTSDLDTNEVAINWADGKLYTKNLAGNIVSVTLGGGGSGSIVAAASVSAFPASGSASNLYITTEDQRIWRWDATASIYVESGPTGGGSGLTWSSVPASATATGTAGQIAYDGYRFYVCTATNTWRRTPLNGYDALIDNALLLTHFDASFGDFGPLALSPTISGSAQISTTQRKFGEGSAYFPSGDANTTNCVKYGSGSTFDIWKGDCTVEAWVYATALTNYSGIVTRDNQADRRNWQLLLSPDGVKPLCFGLFNTSSGAYIVLADSVAFALNQWVHVAAVRDGSVIRLYKNGVQVASANVSTATGTLSTASGNVTIGALNENGNYGFSGYIDEVRILTTCAYKGGTTFTPATAAFTNT